MDKNTYAANNSNLYTTNPFSFKQQTKILFIYNSLCSRAEILPIWRIIRTAKILDFTVLLVPDGTVKMRHLCLRVVNNSIRRVSLTLLLTRNYIQQTCTAQIGKLECYSLCLEAALFVNFKFLKQSNTFQKYFLF